MVSKMVSDRQKFANDFSSWLKFHGGAVAKGVVARLGAKADPANLLSSLAAEGTKLAERLVTADEAHALEAADDAAPRSERDTAAKTLGKVLQDLRDATSAAYGDPGLTALGLHESLPKDPVQVGRVAQRFLGIANAADFEMPAPKRAGTKVELSVFVAEAQPAYKSLKRALEVVDKEVVELQSTQKAKDDALEAFDAFFVAAGGTVRGLAALGGVRDLAGKLPTLFKGGAEAADADTAPPAPEPPPDA